MIERRIRDVAIPSAPTVSAETPASDAARLLCRGDAPAVVVLEGGEIEGILTRSDIVSMVAETSAPLDVGAIMSTPVRTVSPETTLWAAADAMRAYGIEHLPVVEGTDYAGVVSAETLAPFLSRHRLDIVPKEDRSRVEFPDTAGMTTGD